MKYLGDSRSHTLTFMIIWCVTTIGAVLLGWRFSAFDTINNIIVYFVLYIYILGLIYTSWYVFFEIHPETMFGAANPPVLAKAIVLSIAFAIFLEGCTVFGDPSASALNIGDWSRRRIGAFFLIAYTAALVFLLTKKSHSTSLRKRLLSQSLKKIVLYIAVLCADLLVFWLAAILTANSIGLSYPTTCFFFLVVAVSLFSLFAMRKSISIHPERLFLVAALGFGSCVAFCVPAATGMSWDDQIHYGNSLELSYMYGTKYSEADVTLLDPTLPANDWPERENVMGAGKGVPWSQEKVDEYSDQLNATYTRSDISQTYPSNTTPSLLSVATFSTLGYIPSAIGLWLGRLLHLPFAMIFILGRFANLLLYSLVSYAAIKIIPSKKILLCAVALVPTNLFLAASYSYDPWMTALLYLAVALAMREFCRSDQLLSVSSLIIILVVFFVALGPKAVCFPLIGILFMMPRSKFRTSLHRKLYYGLVVVFGLLVVASFAIPLLASGATSVSDPRGGLGVDSAMQVRYILENPLEFASTFTSFIFGDYLSLASSSEYTLNFAYLGNLAARFSFMTAIPLAILFFVALSDSDSCSLQLARISHSVWMGILFILSVAFIVLSLYISFTPVGLNTVNGCQPRYLLPLLFPFLALCLNFKLQNMISRKIYNSAVLVIASVPMVLCCWYLLIGKILV